VFYLAVVLEKAQIVDRGLDPENEAELVKYPFAECPLRLGSRSVPKQNLDFGCQARGAEEERA
jgi:hypothetical protein